LPPVGHDIPERARNLTTPLKEVCYLDNLCRFSKMSQPIKEIT